MKKGIFAAPLAGALLLATAGCDWFGLGKKNDVTQPVGDDRVYQPPLKGDPNRTGDFRRDGVPTASIASTADSSLARPIGVGSRTPAAAATATPEYLVLGSVVANVNGTPIYGHELLRQAMPALRARAKDPSVDAEKFRTIARRELLEQRGHLIRNELEYAAALRNTSLEEQREAQALTFMYREKLVSSAGGSVEMARAIAREQGEDFDRLLKQKERERLVGIYYRKRVFPRVTITVDEMRRYYAQNAEKQFAVPPTATIRVIRVDIKDLGSESAALDRINEARRRALAGEDFATLSDVYNKLPILLQNKGLVGPLSKGSYAIDEVDAAIWTTSTGQVTPVIRTPQAFYIAVVIEKHDGRQKGFEELEVQDEIRQKLRESKMLEINEKVMNGLLEDAAIERDDALVQPVLEMAMQMYPEWHAAGAATPAK